MEMFDGSTIVLQFSRYGDCDSPILIFIIFIILSGDGPHQLLPDLWLYRSNLISFNLPLFYEKNMCNEKQCAKCLEILFFFLFGFLRQGFSV